MVIQIGVGVLLYIVASSLTLILENIIWPIWPPALLQIVIGLSLLCSLLCYPWTWHFFNILWVFHSLEHRMNFCIHVYPYISHDLCLLVVVSNEYRKLRDDFVCVCWSSCQNMKEGAELLQCLCDLKYLPELHCLVNSPDLLMYRCK